LDSSYFPASNHPFDRERPTVNRWPFAVGMEAISRQLGAVNKNPPLILRI
jgi:hypothetical protein